VKSGRNLNLKAVHFFCACVDSTGLYTACQALTSICSSLKQCQEWPLMVTWRRGRREGGNNFPVTVIQACCEQICRCSVPVWPHFKQDENRSVDFDEGSSSAFIPVQNISLVIDL